MKNQYVGDIRDFEKYSLLRSLAAESGLPLVVCWMLTADDEGGDGRKLGYLEDPERYRSRDAHVFDRLDEIVRRRERRVEAVEAAGVLENATFFRRELKGQESSRQFYFKELLESLDGRSLVFFDPDTGLAPPGAAKTRASAAKYVFDDELADVYRRGHSLILFDHFKRISRQTYLEQTQRRLAVATGASSPFALYSAGVAFVILPQEKDDVSLRDGATKIAAAWYPDLTLWDGR